MRQGFLGYQRSKGQVVRMLSIVPSSLNVLLTVRHRSGRWIISSLMRILSTVSTKPIVIALSRLYRRCFSSFHPSIGLMIRCWVMIVVGHGLNIGQCVCKGIRSRLVSTIATFLRIWLDGIHSIPRRNVTERILICRRCWLSVSHVGRWSRPALLLSRFEARVIIIPSIPRSIGIDLLRLIRYLATTSLTSICSIRIICIFIIFTIDGLECSIRRGSSSRMIETRDSRSSFTRQSKVAKEEDGQSYKAEPAYPEESCFCLFGIAKACQS